MNQPEAPPSSGMVAGKYQLVTMIGRGGMGSVWEARHNSLGTRFAIKFIESEYANSQEARTRFDREARAAATIQSKHAIQIYDHGVTEDGKPYIVMELLQGEPLDKRIERMGRLSLPDTVRILHQVCRGLARAHERGIVHRDLKPENIFLVRTPEDDEEIAKVLDFGIAKIQSSTQNPAVSSSTKTGAVLGTPFYMSPEQARGLRNVDHRTDVWSLGVIAYKCVTGQLPFDGESVGDLLVKICTAPVPVPSQTVPGIAPSFDAWFMRALDRDPERRFASVTELAEALGYAAGIAPRSAQPSTPLAHSPFVAGAHASSGEQRHPSRPDAPHANAQTPPPAGMTAAPFTSSAQVAGVGSSGGKIVAGLLAGVIAVGAIVGGVLHFRKAKEAESAGGARLTPAAPSALSVAPQPVDLTTKLEEPTNGQGAAAIVVNSLPPTSVASAKPIVPAKPPTPPTPQTPPVAPAKPTAQTPPLPPPIAKPATPPTPPTQPTQKKPNRNDPGY